MRGAQVLLAYSKELLQLVAIEEGELFRQGSAPTNFTQSIDAAAGQVSAAVLRTSATGATGRGTLAMLRFKALAAGPAEVRTVSLGPVGPAGALPPITALPTLPILVR